MTTPDVPGRILVVDDVMENVRILHQALKSQHEVLFALDGAKAVRVAEDQLPDLILLDAVMPGMDGFAVLAALKESPATRDIPVLFVTALTEPADETRALEAGAVDFITKPINPAAVRARVRIHLTLRRQAELLTRMTLTDGLTGVANRRCLDQTLEQELRRCNRSGQSLSVAMVDVDHFKAFNDRYGHRDGDACLRAVAQGLAGCLHRPADMVARYGGEEFAVVMAGIDLDGARVVAERMLAAVRALDIPHEASSAARHVTISVGIASCVPSRDCTAADLIGQADGCLYLAKRTGRDRACW